MRRALYFSASVITELYTKMKAFAAGYSNIVSYREVTFLSDCVGMDVEAACQNPTSGIQSVYCLSHIKFWVVTCYNKSSLFRSSAILAVIMPRCAHAHSGIR